MHILLFLLPYNLRGHYVTGCIWLFTLIIHYGSGRRSVLCHLEVVLTVKWHKRERGRHTLTKTVLDRLREGGNQCWPNHDHSKFPQALPQAQDYSLAPCHLICNIIIGLCGKMRKRWDWYVESSNMAIHATIIECLSGAWYCAHRSHGDVNIFRLTKPKLHTDLKKWREKCYFEIIIVNIYKVLTMCQALKMVHILNHTAFLVTF